MKLDKKLVGGTLVYADRTVEAAIAINDGTIQMVGSESSMPPAQETIDVSGKIVIPGVVDPHVHVDDMFSIDTYETATSAAALGGITTIIDFGWQAWKGDLSIFNEEGSLLDGIKRKQHKANDSLIDYSLHGAITREDERVLDELQNAVDSGITSFKMFTTYEHGLSYGFIHTVLEKSSELGTVCVFHTEEPTVTGMLMDRFKEAGKKDPVHYPRSRPDYTEEVAAHSVATMAREVGAKYYGFHTSNKKTADILAEKRNDGSQIRAETCTHYTVLTDDIYDELENLPLIAPPIRTAEDNNTLFNHLQNGTLDVVSSDHNAYKRSSKEGNNWWDSAFGLNGLQTNFPVFYDEAINKRGFSYPFLVRTMCTNPARLFGLPNKGSLTPGTDADIVIIDPDEEYTIAAEDNASNADFSVYEGRDISGQVETTLVRGEPVVEDGKLVGTPGYGEFISREIPDWETLR